MLWPYRDSNTAEHKSIPLDLTELIRRYLQHVLPKGFCRVRLFGWLHPAGKIRGNRVRALLKEAPILTAQERQTWQGLRDELPAPIRLALPKGAARESPGPPPLPKPKPAQDRFQYFPQGGNPRSRSSVRPSRPSTPPVPPRPSVESV